MMPLTMISYPMHKTIFPLHRIIIYETKEIFGYLFGKRSME